MYRSEFNHRYHVDYSIGGLIGWISDDNLSVSIELSSTTCDIEILDNPKSGRSYSGGFIGWIENGSVKISESYSNSDISIDVKNGVLIYKRIGGLIGEVGEDVKEFRLENSYYIGDITANQNLEVRIIDRLLNSGSDETKIFNTYSMGTLTHCTDHYGGKIIFGEKPGSHPNAWWQR